jgi:hypothetical protein
MFTLHEFRFSQKFTKIAFLSLTTNRGKMSGFQRMDDKSGQHIQTPYGGGESQVVMQMAFNPLDDKQKVRRRTF